MSLNEILFALTCPVFLAHFKTYQQNTLEQLDRWIEALREAQPFTFCGLPYVNSHANPSVIGMSEIHPTRTE